MVLLSTASGTYSTASNSLKVYPNPGANDYGYWDMPIVYDNYLFFEYNDSTGTLHLGYFDSSILHVLPNLNGNGLTSYQGSPYIFNGLLYFQYEGVSFSNYGNLGYFDASALPVSLLNFTAQKENNATQLQWKTVNEVGNKYFSVERSPDAIHFTTIGQVEGAGSVAVQHQYSFTDKSPEKGMNYYRLKQVDNNGNYTYSSIAKVSFASIVPFSIYPNPAVSTVSLVIPATTGASVVSIFDMAGKKVMENQVSANTVSQTLDVSKLPAGAYSVMLIQPNAAPQTISMMKQ